MKKLSILAFSATVAIAPAFAETNLNYNTPSVDVQPVILLDVPQQSTLPTTAQADLSFAFDNTENLQAVAMANDEMQDIQGAWVIPGAIAGAGTGAWGYMGGAAGSGNFSWKGFGVTVAGGAAVGAITGPVGISRYYTAARVAGVSGFLNSQANK